MHLLQNCCPGLFVECHGELLVHSCLLLHSPIEADAVACAAVLFSPSRALNHSFLVVCLQPNSESLKLLLLRITAPTQPAQDSTIADSVWCSR